jgi:hypothetical protein
MWKEAVRDIRGNILEFVQDCGEPCIPSIRVAYVLNHLGTKFLTNISLECYRFTKLLCINVSE